MKKQLIGLVLSTVSMVGVLGVVAPMSAYAAYSNCPYGQMCAWIGFNGTGQMWSFAFSKYGYTCHALSSTEGYDAWVSVRDGYGSNLPVNVYTDNYCNINYGSTFTIQNGQQLNLPSYMINQVKSFMILHSPTS